jgi:predicted alpha/beta-hydrolase family hydrolase
MADAHASKLSIPGVDAEVDVLVDGPLPARRIYVFGHGAGAGMMHAFMNGVTGRLVERGVTVLRYQFPYMQRGSKRPDRQPVLLATIAAAVARAHDIGAGATVWAGGKSMGGRMTSLAAASRDVDQMRLAGLMFFGFPLHPMGRPGTERADHLSDVTVPMLFLQGTRDALAQLPLVEDVCTRLGERATLHVVPDGDHSFHVRKRETGRNDEAVLDELADEAVGWMERIEGGAAAVVRPG